MDPAAPVEAPDGIRLATTAPSPRSTPRRRRTARVPAGRTRARSRRPRSRADRGRRRPSPPRPRRAAPGLADIAVQDRSRASATRPMRARRRVAVRTHLDGTPGPRPSAVAGRPSASARRCGPPQATRAPASRPDPREAAPLAPASRAPVPSGRYRRGGASRREPPPPPPRPGRRPARTRAWARSHASMVTSRWPAA